MGDQYDSQKPSSYLVYLDANALYGTTMGDNPLPLRGFEWIEERDINKIFERCDNNLNFGCILEVDLIYDKELHKKHACYPLCAIKQAPPGSKIPKLMLTLENKTKYVIHVSMLKFVLEQGLKLAHIHRVIGFYQTKWLEPFIELNTYHRQRATNTFEKNIYKFVSNAIFGKCLESTRNRVDIKIRDKWEGRYQVRNMVAAPNFKKVTVFDENIVAVEMAQTEIFLNKAVAVGFSILDLSKKIMGSFFYEYLKPKYGENLELLYTDTDSFVLQINNVDDYYQDMKEDIHMYDTSDFPADNPYNMELKNKKCPGKFKVKIFFFFHSQNFN